MTSYYIRIRGKAFGPLDEEQLLNMKSQGKLSKTTEISENRADWQPAESLDFLYPQPAHSNGSTGQPTGQVYPSQQTTREPANWNYSVNGTDGFGPVTASAIEQMLQSGHLNGNSYVWQQGQNARFIKNEPRFFNPERGSIRPTQPDDKVTLVGGEITGTSEKVDTGKMLRPIAASLGWIMFLKVSCLLVAIVFQGLDLLLWSVFSVARALALNNAPVLFVTLIIIVFWAGLYALQFKTFLCFWKFHTVLNQTVATGRASDLIQANQRQFLFWKWLGITVIAWLSVAVLSATAVAIASGWFIYYIRDMFQPLRLHFIP